MFATLRGVFRCLRCKTEAESSLQTYLFDVSAKDAPMYYDVGDEGVIDTNRSFVYPLYPWNGEGPLQLVAGDWDCRHCLLNYQWAKLTVSVRRSGSGGAGRADPLQAPFSSMYRGARVLGRIEALETLLPLQPAALDGVHWIEEELVISAFHDGELTSEDLGNWNNLPLETRIGAVVRFFNRWCAKVAGVDPQALLAEI